MRQQARGWRRGEGRGEGEGRGRERRGRRLVGGKGEERGVSGKLVKRKVEGKRRGERGERISRNSVNEGEVEM